MQTYDEFLAFEYVLAHCHDKASITSYKNALEYGRAMEFLNGENKLTQSGKLLASMIGLRLESAYA